jgi:hypothetical protein
MPRPAYASQFNAAERGCFRTTKKSFLKSAQLYARYVHGARSAGAARAASANPWVQWVRDWARKHHIPYACALAEAGDRKSNIRSEYRDQRPVRLRPAPVHIDQEPLPIVAPIRRSQRVRNVAHRGRAGRSRAPHF